MIDIREKAIFWTKRGKCSENFGFFRNPVVLRECFCFNTRRGIWGCFSLSTATMVVWCPRRGVIFVNCRRFTFGILQTLKKV